MPAGYKDPRLSLHSSPWDTHRGRAVGASFTQARVTDRGSGSSAPQEAQPSRAVRYTACFEVRVISQKAKGKDPTPGRPPS